MRPFAALAVLALALPAAAYERAQVNGSGPFLFWATRKHTYQIDSQGTPDAPAASAFDAVRKSFATWAQVTCSDLSFTEEPPGATDRRVGYVSGSTNHNIVLWRTRNCASASVVPPGDPCLTQGGCSNKYDCWDHDSSAIATTTTTSVTSTGEILDADMELNDSAFFFTTVDAPVCPPSAPRADCVAYDVQNTATHEAGHYLGLGHSSATDATMFAFAPSGETRKRQLHADDITGICAIYPKGGPTSVSPGVQPPQSNASSGGCSTSPRASWEMLALLAFALRAGGTGSADRRRGGAGAKEPER